MSVDGAPVVIVGAGPTGALLAILMRRRGFGVTIYESRADPRGEPGDSGRSINLALAARGINALRRVGVYDELRGALLPMRGRLVHDRAGGAALQPYGNRPGEVIYSISRALLNRTLLDIAARRHGVELRFEHRLETADFGAGVATLRDLRSDVLLAVPMRPLLACDGAGSAMRRALSAARLIDARVDDLRHGYKELSIPAGAGGTYPLNPEALHIWPRGGYMLIALPNQGGSFTGTLFLPTHGRSSFASLTDAASIERFLRASFADVVDLMPDRIREFQTNPTGQLGTVRATPWHYKGAAALIGDSAHAIVPFHGQGMNCCLEDCLAFDACLEAEAPWERRFADFYAARKRDTDAIAAMALENYLEMRDRVAHPKFQLQSSLSHELERRHPERFVPRYSMVMFHAEIPYRIALRRGCVQSGLLEDLTRDAARIEDVDFERARREIDARLAPLAQDLSSVMKL